MMINFPNGFTDRVLIYIPGGFFSSSFFLESLLPPPPLLLLMVSGGLKAAVRWLKNLHR
jgi:hypothetical protein